MKITCNRNKNDEVTAQVKTDVLLIGTIGIS